MEFDPIGSIAIAVLDAGRIPGDELSDENLRVGVKEQAKPKPDQAGSPIEAHNSDWDTVQRYQGLLTNARAELRGRSRLTSDSIWISERLIQSFARQQIPCTQDLAKKQFAIVYEGLNRATTPAKDPAR